MTSLDLNFDFGRSRQLSTGLNIPPSSTVLTGKLDGVGVVPTATPLTRLNYFDGRFLRADDLQLDQRYVRAITAQSNRATGSGVSYGLDVSGGDGTITISAGLAIAASGRVIYLPSASPPLSIEDIVRASQNLQATFARPTSGGAKFGSCELTGANGDPTFAPVADAWVVTVGPSEAACGDEDVHGRLCEDACVTDSQKSHLVDAVAVRMVPLNLAVAMPTSAAVPDSAINLRSRVAAAYFATERQRIADLRSAAGLASPAWCQGAAAEAGETVAIAVVVRGGGQTQFVDPWTVRRELMETPPTRYWAARTGRRPMAAFLAQVLQFQCQLLSAVSTGQDPQDPNDPCADERRAISDAAELLNNVEDTYQALLGKIIDTDFSTPQLSLLKLNEVRASLLQAAAGSSPGRPSNRRLINHGIIDAPPAGFLPITPGANDVEDQVRAWFGEGVDLRFCVARPDVIAQAFDEAQHLNRISLTKGLDDPALLDDVDVLVPDGVIEEDDLATSGNGLQAQVKVYPDVIGAEQTSAAQLDGAGQYERLDSGGVAVAFAASGVAPERLAVGAVYELAHKAVLEGKTSDLIKTKDRIVTTNAETLKELAGDPEIARRLRDIATDAREHLLKTKADKLYIDPEQEPEVDKFTPSAATKRPIGWFSSLRFDADPETLISAKSVPVSFEMVSGAPAIELQALVSAAVSGTFAIDNVNDLGEGFVARGRLVGPGSWLIIADGDVSAEGGAKLSLPMSVVVSRRSGNRPSQVLVAIGMKPELKTNRSGDQLVFTVKLERNPDKAEGGLYLAREDKALGDLDLEKLLTATFAAAPVEAQPIVSFALQPDQDVLRPGNVNRDRALGGVELVAAMVADRDPGLNERALDLLFPPAEEIGKAKRIRATKDWVMFHRRAERICVDDQPTTPVANASYRLFHGAVDSLEEAEKLRAEIAAGQGGDRLDEVGIVQYSGGTAALASSETALLADWQRVRPGNVVRYTLVAPTLGNVPLAEQRLRRMANAVRSVSVTVADTVTEALPAVPGGLDSRDTDGVMIAVTVNEQQTTCHSVWRLNPESTKKLAPGQENLGPSELVRLGVAQQFDSVEFDASSTAIVSDTAELVDSWGEPAVDADAQVLVFSTPGNSEAGSDALLTLRGRKIASTLGYSENIEVDVIRRSDLPAGCQAATVIVERPLGSCQSVFLVDSASQEIEDISAALKIGDIEAVVSFESVKSLGSLTFQAGNLQISDQTNLQSVPVPSTFGVQALTASEPNADPEANLISARAEVATLAAVGRQPSSVAASPDITSFPDVDCPTVVLIVAQQIFFDRVGSSFGRG